MDERHYEEQRTEDEIDLKELFLVIWKKKLFIISITLIAAIISGIISLFILSPVYHSRLNIIINMPEAIHTKYGDYTLPITSNEQYINLITSSDILSRTIEDMAYDTDSSIEPLRDRITIDIPDAKANTTQNSFYVRVSADNPAEAKKLAQTLFDNYIDFLDILIADGALDYYTNKYNISISSLEDQLTSNQVILAKNEALLATTPQTINQRDAMQEIQESSNTSEYIVLENIINPNYTKIENDIISNKQSINSIENSIRVYNDYLAELDELKIKMSEYNDKRDYSELDKDFVKITKSNVYLPSDPIEPSRKTSPNNTLNIIIGALLGGMASVFVVLIKEYWFESK